MKQLRFPRRTAILGLAIAGTLSACGQRGPLYLPKPDAPPASTVQTNKAQPKPAQAASAPAGDASSTSASTPDSK